MSAQPNQSLIDGLACMQALAVSSKPIGCRELGRMLDLNPMRANRLLKTLADIGLAQQDDKKRYAIGPGIHALAAQSMFGSGILRKALPLLKALRGGEFDGLIVAIGVLWRDQVTYLFHGTIGADLEQGIGRTGLYPASQSSIGMALLAQQSDAELNALYPEGFPGFATVEDFFEAINEIRSCDYAAIKSEGKTSHYSLAVPIGTNNAAPSKPSIAIAFSGMPLNTNLSPCIQELQSIASGILS